MQTSTLNTAHISLGTNLGNRLKNLADARQFIRERIGDISITSSVYETEPWGDHQQPDFYNQVVVVETVLSPGSLMKELLAIEELLGRVRTFKNASRLIDLDILFYDDAIVRQNGVHIPHPQIANRRFVLVPLSQIAGGMIHPVHRKSINTLLKECDDPLEVRIVNE